MSETTTPNNGIPEQTTASAPTPEQIPGPPPQKRSRRKLIIISAIAVLAFIVAFALTGVFLRTAFAGPSKQEIIEKAVAELQAQVPQTVDELTTLTNVTAEPSAIHYEYTLSGDVDPSSITEDVVRSVVLPTLCSTKETLAMLKDDISMRYSYLFDGSSDEVDVTFTKDDC